MHTFTIHAGLTAGDTYIELDGKRINNVTAIDFSARPHTPTEITLKVRAYVDITGVARETEVLNIKRDRN